VGDAPSAPNTSGPGCLDWMGWWLLKHIEELVVVNQIKSHLINIKLFKTTKS
jgi:hypothetical protein